MPRPELGLDAFDASVTCVKLLIFIIKTAQQVKRLNSKCLELADVATILRDMLNANKRLLEDEKTEERFRHVLEDIARFVASCNDFNVFEKTWEVAWRKRLPSLENELMKWVLLFSTETTVLTRAASMKLLEGEKEARDSEQDYREQMSNKLEILDELKRDLDQKKVEDGLKIDYRDGDDRLTISTCDDELLTGILSLEDGEDVKIAGKPVKKDLGSYGDKGPRHVKIYGKISANTSVHPFYGIAVHSGRTWALFKDFRHCPTLSKIISRDELPQDLPARLAIAHEIALTMNYLHSVEVLVKRLSDKNVILVSEGETWKPYLTDLQRARLFTESTSGGEYDIRYEAVEFQRVRGARHSIYTDVWSLGILLWECISGLHPFGKAGEVTGGDEAARIRADVENGRFPWRSIQSDSTILRQVSKVVEGCCNPLPKVRPTASKVAHALSDILILSSIEVEEVPTTDEMLKRRVAELVDQAARSRAPVKDIVSKADAELLQMSAAQGDVTSSYLLGAGLWYGAIRVPDEVQQLILAAEEDRSKELRARAAREYLEDAIRGGVKAAAIPLMRLHEALMILYQEEATRHRAMGLI